VDPADREDDLHGAAAIAELADQIEARILRAGGGWSQREQARLAAELETILQQSLMERFHAADGRTRYNQVLQQVYTRRLSPWEAVGMLIKEYGGLHERDGGAAEGT
jgi:hypothetical protein